MPGLRQHATTITLVGPVEAVRGHMLVEPGRERRERAVRSIFIRSEPQAVARRHGGAVHALARRILRSDPPAEEVTQDAFIRAHRGLVNFRGDSAFSTWLYQIATNLARNRYWYWWRRKRDKSISFDAPVSGDNDTTLAELIPAEQETPEDATVTQEFVNRVAECMELLNEKHREILILRNVQNLAYEEIAEILGISVGTVKSRIARARESLREKLGGEFQP